MLNSFILWLIAGAEGLEPPLPDLDAGFTVLETAALPLHQAPIRQVP